jgi:hypothetical protein
MAEDKSKKVAEESNESKSKRESKSSILRDILKNGTESEKKVIEKLISNRKSSKELVEAVSNRCRLSDKIETIKTKLVNEGTFTIEQVNEIVSETEKSYKAKKEKKKAEKKTEKSK